MNDITPLLKVAEAAEYLSVSADTVRRLITSGKLPHARIGNSIRFRRSDLDTFVAANTSTTWTRVDGRGRPRSGNAES